MASDGSAWVRLIGRSAASWQAELRLDAQAQIAAPRADCGKLVCRYVLRGELRRLLIPASTGRARADGLWQHTCFEAFLRPPGAPGYYEFNVAPSGQWAVYRFAAYRESMSSPDLATSPQIAVRRFADRLEIDAELSLAQLSGLDAAPRLSVALSAVVEDENGNLSYWALKHAPGKADFHHPEGFMLDLVLDGP